MKYFNYVAYGSNLNMEQMAWRCPGAKVVGTGVLEHTDMVFNGAAGNAHATIVPNPQYDTPVLVWKVSEDNLKALDRYEGVAGGYYYRKEIPVTMDSGKVLKGIVYIMNPQRKPGRPSLYYEWVIRRGYQDCGFSQAVLQDFLDRSEQRFLISTK